MFKKVTCLVLASLFMAGSILLPLSDFSLVRDLPTMYRNYTKITTGDEVGIIDFVGDYLLHGKELFGNNIHDKVPVKGCDVQFQHQANPLNIVLLKAHVTLLFGDEYVTEYPCYTPYFNTSNFVNRLFRPPLV